MFSLPRWLGSRRAHRSAPPRQVRPAQLGLEQLEDREVPATMSAASSSAMFLIRADQSVWEYSSKSGWLQLTSPGFAVSVSAVHESATGNDVVYALATNGFVYQYHLGASWNVVGGYFTSISAGHDASGFAEVFAVTRNNGLFEFNRTGVKLRASNVSSVAAAGAETAYAVLTDGSVSTFTSTGSTSIAAAGSAVQVVATAPSSGSPAIYIVNRQGFVYVSTGGAWNPLFGNVGAMSAGTDANGNAAFFAIGGINGGLTLPALYEFSSQSNGQQLGYFQQTLSATDSDTVFVTLSDHSVWSHTTVGGWVNLAPSGTALV